MKWKYHTPDANDVDQLRQEFRCSDIIAKVLANRGFKSLSQSKSFFSPDSQQLHDPFLMKDMQKAVDRIHKNIKTERPILIFGDYDVDGTTGASMLFLALKEMGAIVSTYIPDREKEGYGVSEQGIQTAATQGADLMITCDCGINAIDQVKIAASKGIDFIITDHHIPDEKLPEAFAILNPKQADCNYPFKGLCGGGVAFKLAGACASQLGHDNNFMAKYFDLITLGTTADIVPIIDENRVIVHHGLKRMQQSKWVGLRALIKVSHLTDKELNVERLVFSLAPKINAAGRLGDANRAVELLTTTDSAKAKQLAQELEKENSRRQKIQQSVVDEAFLMVNAQIDLSSDRAIVLWKHGWHPGVVGIVASKLKEEFHRPTIIISIDKKGVGKGSARSIKGLNLYEILSECADMLDGYGGHKMAAGLTIHEKNLDQFRKRFVHLCNLNLTKEALHPSIYLEGDVIFRDINNRFMDFLDRLAPYGPGNMRPKFSIRKVRVSGNPKIIGNGDHICFNIRQGQTNFNAIGFNMSQHYEKLINGNPVDLAFLVEKNEWQGQSSIQLNIRDIKIHH